MSGAGTGAPSPALEVFEPEPYLRRHTFSPGEMARICRVDPKTLAIWAKAGKCPHLRTPGGHRRYRRCQLDFLPAEGDPQLVTFMDIARAAGVGIRTVHWWADSGRFDWVRLPGGHRRVWRPVAAEFLAKRRANGL